jgi:hypothetical protein
MRQYTTAAAAITDLHERGFTSDFQVCGTDLFWVQQKIFIRTAAFAVVEYHRLWNPAAQQQDMVLLGIIAIDYNIRGILFIDNATIASNYPPVISHKINELNQKVLYRNSI